jgi:hypothetical protein
LSEKSVVGPRASGFSPGKDGEAGDIGYGEAGDIGCIVDGAGRRPDEKQAVRSQMSFLTQPLFHSLLPERNKPGGYRKNSPPP